MTSLDVAPAAFGPYSRINVSAVGDWPWVAESFARKKRLQNEVGVPTEGALCGGPRLGARGEEGYVVSVVVAAVARILVIARRPQGDRSGADLQTPPQARTQTTTTR